MSNKKATDVRKSAGSTQLRPDSARSDDPRVARTVTALGRALVELIEQESFDTITVQAVLDRAGVARSTFYAHYRNNEDVLHESYERLFAHLESLLGQSAKQGARLFPLREFLEHIGTSGALVAGLRRSGRLDELWLLFADYSARIIGRRLPDTVPSGPARALHSRMLAGALLESVRWWSERRSPVSPAEMDRSFHALASRALRVP